MKVWLATQVIQHIKHPQYLPDLVPADFFLYRKVKEKLAGPSLNADSIKNTLEGVITTTAIEQFATAFTSKYKYCKKCTKVGDKYIKKYLEIIMPLTLTIVFLFH